MAEAVRLGIYVAWAAAGLSVGFMLSGLVAVLLAMLLVIRGASPLDRVGWGAGAAAAFLTLAYLHLAAGMTISLVATPVLFGGALLGMRWLGIGDAAHPFVQRLRLPAVRDQR